MRITLSQAAEIIDRLHGPLPARERYVAARHLQRRLAGEPRNRPYDESTFDAWEEVSAVHEIPPLR